MSYTHDTSKYCSLRFTRLTADRYQTFIQYRCLVLCTDCPEFRTTGVTDANQRTSGPVNSHLTPCPGIYCNAFIHVYSPRAGTDNPFGINVDVNRKLLSLCQSVASFKTICLKYDFKHILNVFIHVYSPKAGTDNPLGTKF